VPLSLKLPVFIACALVGILLAVLLAASLLLNSGYVHERLQERIATSYALELGTGGRLDVDFFPALQFTLNELDFSRLGIEVASVRQVRIGLDVWPLLRGDVRINSIALLEPVIRLERYQDGSYNISKPESRTTLKLTQLLVENSSLHFKDALTGTQYAADSCNVDLQSARSLTLYPMDHPVDLDIAAEFSCAEFRKDDQVFTDLKFSARGQGAVVIVDPLSVQMFGAHGTGKVLADFTGTVPRYQLSYILPQFRIDELFRMLMPGRTPEGTLEDETLVEGLMDFSTSLTMQGQSLQAAQQNLSGVLTLRGENLVINGANLDASLASYEASQNFSLVDAGAFLLAGPLGLVVTKGYNFANIFWDPGTSSEIPAIVSDWTVADGIAQAQYVVMTTLENRIALKGGLDFPDQQFNNLKLALLDKEGCARVEQEIRGSFLNPEIDKPNVFWSLAGPIRALLQKLGPADACEPFYPVTARPQEQ